LILLGEITEDFQDQNGYFDNRNKSNGTRRKRELSPQRGIAFEGSQLSVRPDIPPSCIPGIRWTLGYSSGTSKHSMSMLFFVHAESIPQPQHHQCCDARMCGMRARGVRLVSASCPEPLRRYPHGTIRNH